MMDLPSLIEKYKMNITGVLHCGGSTGQERDLYSSIGDIDVWWIEAIPEVYEQLKENIKGCKNQCAIKACIGDVDGEEVEFNVSNNEAQSSSYLQLSHHVVIHPEVHYVSSFKTKAFTLWYLLCGAEMREVNFLNLDLQGAEMKALKGMGKLLDQFDYLWIEVNKKETYTGCSLVDEFDAYLYDFLRVETGEWVADTWTDALYIRKTLL